MAVYILRRFLMIIPVLLGVTFLTFAIIQIVPGDPVEMMLGPEATQDVVNRWREQLGLNDPLWVQYARYVWNAAHGDLGRSLRGQTSVLDEILRRFPSTLQLTLSGMLLAIPGGVGAGIVAAVSKRKRVDGLTMVIALAGISIPSFWLAIILVIVFGVHLKWVSVIGGEGLKDLILPAFCLALGPAAVLARLTRSTILEVVREDYVQTARAKGLAEKTVNLRHVLRNALIPVVTVIGMQFGRMLTGTFFIEAVFARPGLGRFAIGAISERDYPQVQGMVLFTATVFVLVNLFIDVLYGFLDPRIRVS